MEERTCKVCGRTLPIDDFAKYGKYHRYICKACQNEKIREWRKTKRESGDYKEHASPESREKKLLKEGLARLKRKIETGTTYRNKADAEKKRAYQREYERKNRNNPQKKETQRRCSRNYIQRKKMKEEVVLLEEFFDSDFFD